MKIIKAICSVALTVGAVALICGSATARENDAPPQRIVRYSDLNLNHEDGVKVLYQRLTTAARAVCPVQFSVPQTLRSKALECARIALDNAVAQVDNSNLTAYHDAKTSREKLSETKVASRR